MNQSPFVQVPCVKCGATVWISPATGMGFCPSCQTQNQLPPGAAAGTPAPGGYGAPPMGGPPMGGPPGGYPGAPGGPPMGGPPGGYPGAPPMGGAPMGGAPGGPPMGGPPMGGAPGGYPGAPGGAPGGYPGAPGGPPMGGPPMGGPPMGGAPGGYPGAPGGPPMGGPPMGGPGAPPPMGGYGAPGGPPMGQPPMATFSSGGRAGGSSGNMLKAIGGGVGSVVLVIVLVIFKIAVRSGSSSVSSGGNAESFSSLGIDKKKGDPDKMIAAARAYALKWKSDAGFWSVNIQKLGSDGTVDLTTSNVMVEYFSPSAVSSPNQKMRDDSIKKFNFMNDEMTYRDIWGVRKQYNPAPRPTAIPGCTAKQLAAKLVGMGLLKTGGTIHAQIDPAFGDEWLVQTGGAPRRFDLQTCGEKK
ncbi:MAG: hypothetical protein QM820_04075 [Minicystis sp.]